MSRVKECYKFLTIKKGKLNFNLKVERKTELGWERKNKKDPSADAGMRNHRNCRKCRLWQHAANRQIKCLRGPLRSSFPFPLFNSINISHTHTLSLIHTQSSLSKHGGNFLFFALRFFASSQTTFFLLFPNP